MAHRYFEEKSHAELYTKYRNNKYPESIFETIISYVKEKIDNLDFALDVGCGSGQVTFNFAQHFKNVVGTDISEAQIEYAIGQNKLENVQFLVSPSEKLPFPDKSVQLITCAASAHWFDLPKFFLEAQRLLVPGGVLAIFSYGYPEILELENDPDKGKCLDMAFQKLYKDDLKGYWSDRLKIACNKYRDVTLGIPYEDFKRYDNDEFFIEKETELEEFINNFRTSSGYQSFISKNGASKGEELIENFRKSAENLIGQQPHYKEGSKNLTIKEKIITALIIARNGQN